MNASKSLVLSGVTCFRLDIKSNEMVIWLCAKTSVLNKLIVKENPPGFLLY